MEQPPAAPAAGIAQGTGHCPAVQAGKSRDSNVHLGSELASAACEERTPSNGSPNSTQSQQRRGHARQLQEMQPYGPDNSSQTTIGAGQQAEQLQAAHRPGGRGPLAPQGVRQLMQPGSSQARQSAPGGADGAGTGDDEGEEEVGYSQEQVRALLGA